jgi:hypothetical protein
VSNRPALSYAILRRSPGACSRAPRGAHWRNHVVGHVAKRSGRFSFQKADESRPPQTAMPYDRRLFGAPFVTSRAASISCRIASTRLGRRWATRKSSMRSRSSRGILTSTNWTSGTRLATMIQSCTAHPRGKCAEYAEYADSAEYACENCPPLAVPSGQEHRERTSSLRDQAARGGRAGELLAATEKAKPRGSNQHEERLRTATDPPTLAELGLTKTQSAKWRRIAAILSGSTNEPFPHRFSTLSLPPPVAACAVAA